MILSGKDISLYADMYSQINGWQKMQLDVLNEKTVLERYKIDKNKKKDKSTDSNSNENAEVTNATAKDIVEGKIGCISIPQMISSFQMDEDKIIIDKYLDSIKDYQALVIDIRGNGGGDSGYWINYLVPKIIDKTYSNTNYNFWKDGEWINKFIKKAGYKLNKHYYEISDLDANLLPNLAPDVLIDFKYYKEDSCEINPKDSVMFKGRIYLLVDRNVYSSAEGFADFSKNSGFATLIGERTGGDGVGSDPLLVNLPNSGYVFRFSKDMGVSSNGICNEEYKTVPHYEITNTKKTDDLSEDECIEKVLELEKAYDTDR